MECPECNEELKIPENTLLNMDSYGKSCLTITKCCGSLVTTFPVRGFTVQAYDGDETEDDWGRTPTRH